MNIAIGKDGRIGRKIRSDGEQAVVETPRIAERRGTVEVSHRSIADDNAYWNTREKLRIAELTTAKIERQARKMAEEQALLIKNRQLEARQKPKNSALEVKVADYLLGKAEMSESEKVARTISADFTNDSGYNILPADPSMEDEVRTWAADFRQNKIIGNPLTRNGVYGVVTDYDRIVSGTEMTNAQPVIVGGTMVGRFQDRSIKCKTTKGHGGQRPGKAAAQPMGSFWDSATNWLGTVSDRVVDQVQTKLPESIADRIAKEIAGGGKVSTSPTGQVTVYKQEPAQYTTIQQQIPPIVYYGVFGVLGLGVLAVLLRATK